MHQPPYLASYPKSVLRAGILHAGQFYNKLTQVEVTLEKETSTEKMSSQDFPEDKDWSGRAQRTGAATWRCGPDSL